MGRLTRDPDIKYTHEQMPVADIGIAVDRSYKKEGQKNVDFFNCVAFSKTAQFCEKYLKKGTKVVLEGHLQNEEYLKDGKTQIYTKIYIDCIEFAESKNSQTQEEPKPSPKEEPYMDVPADMDDLPFK